MQKNGEVIAVRGGRPEVLQLTGLRRHERGAADLVDGETLLGPDPRFSLAVDNVGKSVGLERNT